MPRRTVERKFTAADVARIFCHAIENGVTEEEIEARIEFKCDRDRKKKSDSAVAVAQMAVEVSQGNLDTFGALYNLFLLINGLILGLAAVQKWLRPLVKRIPTLYLALRGITGLESTVQAQVIALQSRVAANEQLYQAATILLRRAA